ncbi:MAG: hypothetical protein M9955_01210 [Rhizobiaceae bacterium]|nr:hypothetical protein [Rhizobiaceae bacterium]
MKVRQLTKIYYERRTVWQDVPYAKGQGEGAVKRCFSLAVRFVEPARSFADLRENASFINDFKGSNGGRDRD